MSVILVVAGRDLSEGPACANASLEDDCVLIAPDAAKPTSRISLCGFLVCKWLNKVERTYM